MIGEDKITEIIDKTDMVGLVSEYVSLTKRGKNYFGLCPFHDDQSPSFSVSPEKKIAKCMSCGEGGNPINFLRKIKNISFEDACYLLADRNGITLERTRTFKKEDTNLKYYEINQIAQQFYQHFLFNSQTGKEALNYLNKRGLSLETIKMFGIGLAPKEHDTLVRVLKDKNYSLTDASDIGLIKSNKEGYYDIFKNRIMFPIFDEEGHVLAFSGRIFMGEVDQPKYVNTEETVIYKKGEMLYNLNNAVPSIRKTGRVILCEGQLDVISLSNAGFKEAVCSLGTALTKEQVSLLSKYTKNVVISYDGDNAGIKATQKAFNLLKGFNANALLLPDGADPDEFIKKYGAEGFNEYLKENLKDPYAFTYLNAFRGRNLTLSYDYEEVKKDIFKFLLEANSSALIEKYLKQLSIDLKVSYDAIFNDYNLYSKGSYGQKDVEISEQDENNLKDIKAHEKIFIYFIALDKKYFQYFEEEISDIANYIESPVILNMYIAIAYFYNALDNKQDEIFKYCYSQYKTSFVYDMMSGVTEVSMMDSIKVEKMLEDCINRFKEVKFKQIRSEFEINSLIPSEEDVETLNQKLAFVRQNKIKRRK